MALAVNNIIEDSEEDQDSLAIRKRSVVISGHRTSVSLENAFWFGLKEVAGRKADSQSIGDGDRQRTHGKSSRRSGHLSSWKPRNAGASRALTASNS